MTFINIIVSSILMINQIILCLCYIIDIIAPIIVKVQEGGGGHGGGHGGGARKSNKYCMKLTYVCVVSRVE